MERATAQSEVMPHDSPIAACSQPHDARCEVLLASSRHGCAVCALWHHSAHAQHRACLVAWSTQWVERHAGDLVGCCHKPPLLYASQFCLPVLHNITYFLARKNMARMLARLTRESPKLEGCSIGCPVSRLLRRSRQTLRVALQLHPTSLSLFLAGASSPSFMSPVSGYNFKSGHADCPCILY